MKQHYLAIYTLSHSDTTSISHLLVLIFPSNLITRKRGRPLPSHLFPPSLHIDYPLKSGFILKETWKEMNRIVFVCIAYV